MLGKQHIDNTRISESTCFRYLPLGAAIKSMTSEHPGGSVAILDDLLYALYSRCTEGLQNTVILHTPLLLPTVISLQVVSKETL